jgi:cell division protein FtsZ
MSNQKICVKMVGVGSAGCRVVDYLAGRDIGSVDFIAIDSFFYSSGHREDIKRVVIGECTEPRPFCSITSGWAKQAVKDDDALIKQALQGADLVLLLSGLGGGVGSGAAPEILRICKEIEAVSVAVISDPFWFEGNRCQTRSKEALPIVGQRADMVVDIPHNRLREMVPPTETVKGAFKFSDFVFSQAVKGILGFFNSSEKYLLDGDFDYTKQFLESAGLAHMGFASGKTLLETMESALSCPLFPGKDLSMAEKLFVSLSCPPDTTFDEVNKSMDLMNSRIQSNADCLWNTSVIEAAPEVILYAFQPSVSETLSA